jgi:hypothetical protein
MLPAATTGDTPNALMVIIEAPSSRLVAAAVHEKTRQFRFEAKW